MPRGIGGTPEGILTAAALNALGGVKLIARKAITHSILMRSRSRTVRFIRAIHDLDSKTIHLRSARAERKL